MANVGLICLYDHRALGLRAISNALQAAGHEVTIIHFKLPTAQNKDYYLDEPTHYEAIHTSDLHRGFGIRKYNYDINPWTSKELQLLTETLSSMKPDIVGITTRSAYEQFLPEIAEIMHGSGAITVAGGFGATFALELHARLFDYVCQGEGELPMLKIAAAMDAGHPMDNIGGLVWLQKGELMVSPLIPPSTEDFLYNFAMTSVRHLVIEAEQLHDSDILLRRINLSHEDEESYHTMAGLGCLNNCSYCCAGRMVKLYKEFVNIPKRRMRSVENVIEELKFAHCYGFQTVTFLDSFLVASPEYLRELFESYRLNVGLPFFAQFFPSQILLHPDILDIAIEAGLNFTVIGIQSGSDRVNREIYNRNMPNHQVLEFAEMLSQKKTVRIQYHIITHNPFINDQDFNDTLELIRCLPKENAELVLIRLRPFPGTEIAERLDTLPVSKRLSNDKEHVRSLLYLLRFFLTDNEFDKAMTKSEGCNFETIKDLFREKVIASGCISKFSGNQSILVGEIDALPYQVKSGIFGKTYKSALDAWLKVPNMRNLKLLDKLFKEKAWEKINKTPDGTKVNLFEVINGTGWGEAESNTLGQNWRWVGPTGRSSIILRVENIVDYSMETLIHTALGETLFAIEAKANEVAATHQHIVREGDLFFHRCVIPASLIAAGILDIEFNIKADKGSDIVLQKARQVALTHIILNRS